MSASEHIAWGVAQAPRAKEVESGDLGIVLPSADGVLIGAVDGIGHGAEAAAAARIAADTLAAFARESPISLVRRCHEELLGTRGVVMTLAFIHRHQPAMTWLGVGNVEAGLFHPRPDRNARPRRALLRPGVVGHQLPALRAEVLPLTPLDTLVVVTDGITPDCFEAFTSSGDPQHIADGILSRHRRQTDDALAVVVRYLGDKR